MFGGAAAENRAAAGIGPGRHRDAVAVALDNPDVLEFRAEIVRDDLGQRGFQPLSMRGDAERRRDRAGRIDADLGGFRTGVDRHSRRNGNSRADPGQLGIACQADAEIAPFRARRALLLPQRLISGRLRRRFETFDEAGLVPDDPGADPIGKFI